MKTNKALKKRVRITKRGKTLVRASGHGHFKAKMPRTSQLEKKKLVPVRIAKKILRFYLPNK